MLVGSANFENHNYKEKSSLLNHSLYLNATTAGRGAPPENPGEWSCRYNQSGAKGQAEKG